MFPVMLDDQYLAMEFQIFIEAVDNSHDLALDGHQQYPVWLFQVFWFVLPSFFSYIPFVL